MGIDVSHVEHVEEWWRWLLGPWGQTPTAPCSRRVRSRSSSSWQLITALGPQQEWLSCGGNGGGRGSRQVVPLAGWPGEKQHKLWGLRPWRGQRVARRIQQGAISFPPPTRHQGVLRMGSSTVPPAGIRAQHQTPSHTPTGSCCGWESWYIDSSLQMLNLITGLGSTLTPLPACFPPPCLLPPSQPLSYGERETQARRDKPKKYLPA